MEPRMYELKKGDRFSLGCGNFKKIPRRGDYLNDMPIVVLKVMYCKRKKLDFMPDVLRNYHRWMFWVRKRRIIVLCEFLGEGDKDGN